jgi:hypothetical protein
MLSVTKSIDHFSFTRLGGGIITRAPAEPFLFRFFLSASPSDDIGCDCVAGLSDRPIESRHCPKFLPLFYFIF